MSARRVVWQSAKDARLAAGFPAADEGGAASDRLPLGAFHSDTPADNAMRGALARSLEANPLELFDAAWLAATLRRVVRHANKRTRTGTRVSALLNLRLRVEARADHAADHGVLVPHWRAAPDSDTVALITVVVRPTAEALLARQLRSRALPLAAASRYALRADDLPERVGIAPPESSAARRLVGARLFDALATRPTLRTFLVHDLTRDLERRTIPPPPPPRRVAVVDDDDSDELLRNPLASESDSFDSQHSLSLLSDDASEAIEVDEADIESGSAESEPSGIDLDSSSNDAPSSSSSSSSLPGLSSGSFDSQASAGIRSSGSSTPPDAQAGSASDDEDEPALCEAFDGIELRNEREERAARLAPPDTRTDEFTWLRVVLQQRAFSLGFEITHQAPYSQMLTQLRRFDVPLDALPESLHEHVASDDALATDGDRIGLLFGRASALRTAERGRRVLTVCRRPPAPPTPDASVESAGSEPPPPPPPVRPSVVVAREPDTLLGALARIDVADVHMYEFETYARARLDALLRAKAHEPATRYPSWSGASRYTLEALGAGALRRESRHETLGLLVLALVAARDKSLLADLYFLEELWMRDAELDGEPEQLEAHLDSIDRFCDAAPELNAAPDDPAGERFVALLDALARDWSARLD